MNSHPEFSIIIPTYNRSTFLRKAIQSVCEQTFGNWEIIIVDDGSTDDTKIMISNFHNNRIFYYYQQNRERSAARNNGVVRSKGEYICFLDSDDFYFPTHLENLHEFLVAKNKPVAMIFTGFEYLENERSKGSFLPNFSGNPMIFFIKNPIIPSCVCIHRKILETVTFDETVKIVEDAILWIKISNIFPVYHLSKATVGYSLHENNSVSLFQNSFSFRLKGMKKLFSEFPQKDKIPTYIRNEELSNCYYGIAKYYYLNRSFIYMILMLLKSFIKNPVNSHNKAKLFMIKSYLFGPKIKQF